MKKIHLNQYLDFLKVESSAFSFVCLEISNLLKLEISTLLKLENSCLLLFSKGLKFQALEGLKSNAKADDSNYSYSVGNSAALGYLECAQSVTKKN